VCVKVTKLRGTCSMHGSFKKFLCFCRLEKVNGRVHWSLFTAEWMIVVGRSRVRGKVLTSPCVRCDVADGMDLAVSAWKPNINPFRSYQTTDRPNTPGDRPTKRNTRQHEWPTNIGNDELTDWINDRLANWLTNHVTELITDRPTNQPDDGPAEELTDQSTNHPTQQPTKQPTFKPTDIPLTHQPTSQHPKQATNQAAHQVIENNWQNDQLNNQKLDL